MSRCSRIVRLLGFLAVLWLAGAPADLFATTATPTPIPALAGRRVVKEICRSLEGYSLEALKRELELIAKREAANELFGELIVASTTVQNWTVTEDQLRSQSLGLVRVEGSPVFRNGTNLGELCASVTAYATAQDFARFAPQTITKRVCVSGDDMTLRAVRLLAEESARLQALIDYDPRLAGYDGAAILPLLRRVTYLESNVVTDTDNYCVKVQGAVIPIEVEGFLAMDGTLLGLPDGTPMPAATANLTPIFVATATTKVDDEGIAVATVAATPTLLPAATATATRAPLPTPRPTATRTQAPTPTITPAPEVQVEPVAATRAALLTLRSQIYATQTAIAAGTRTAVTTPRPAAPATAHVALLAPADGVTTNERLDFAWTAIDLPAGYAYELVFWCCDPNAAMTDGRGYAGGYTTQTSASMNFAAGGLSYGEYQWAILLVKQAPYQRIRPISEVRTVYFADPTRPPQGGSGGGGEERP